MIDASNSSSSEMGDCAASSSSSAEPPDSRDFKLPEEICGNIFSFLSLPASSLFSSASRSLRSAFYSYTSSVNLKATDSVTRPETLEHLSQFKGLQSLSIAVPPLPQKGPKRPNGQNSPPVSPKLSPLPAPHVIPAATFLSKCIQMLPTLKTLTLRGNGIGSASSSLPPSDLATLLLSLPLRCTLEAHGLPLLSIAKALDFLASTSLEHTPPLQIQLRLTDPQQLLEFIQYIVTESAQSIPFSVCLLECMESLSPVKISSFAELMLLTSPAVTAYFPSLKDLHLRICPTTTSAVDISSHLLFSGHVLADRLLHFPSLSQMQSIRIELHSTNDSWIKQAHGSSGSLSRLLSATKMTHLQRLHWPFAVDFSDLGALSKLQAASSFVQLKDMDIRVIDRIDDKKTNSETETDEKKEDNPLNALNELLRIPGVIDSLKRFALHSTPSVLSEWMTSTAMEKSLKKLHRANALKFVVWRPIASSDVNGTSSQPDDHLIREEDDEIDLLMMPLSPKAVAAPLLMMMEEPGVVAAPEAEAKQDSRGTESEARLKKTVSEDEVRMISLIAKTMPKLSSISLWSSASASSVSGSMIPSKTGDIMRSSLPRSIAVDIREAELM